VGLGWPATKGGILSGLCPHAGGRFRVESANSLKIKVIKTQDKEIKLKDNDPRHMRSKS
jgi:Ribonuclease G/E